MKISIITPTKNAEIFIGDTLESVKRQSYHNVEHIICDSMSSDNTLQICSKYNTRIIQRQDKSMYDAENHGILVSEGDILAFLNADDLYYSEETLEKVAKVFLSDDSIDVVYGKCMVADVNLNYLYTHYPSKKLNFNYAVKRTHVVGHPATFFRKRVFSQHTLYDLQFRAMADCDLILTLLKRESHFKYLDDVLCIFRRHKMNLSDTPESKGERKKIFYKFNRPEQYKWWPFYFFLDNINNYRYLIYLLKRRLMVSK